MRRINIFLLTGMVLFGFEIEGPVWQEGYVVVSPNLGGLYNTVVFNCVDVWNSELHYGDYFVDFSFQSSNTEPYNIRWGKPKDNAVGFTYWHSDKNYFDTAWIVIDSMRSWCLDGSPGPHEFDLRTVIKHELGHLGGLGDVFDDTSVVMYAHIDSGEVRHIQDDDVEGMACLYGDESNGGYIGFSIEEPSGKMDNIYWCCVPVIVGICLGGTNVNGVSLLINGRAGEIAFFERVDNVTTRLYATSFITSNTGGKVERGRVCVTMYRNGSEVGRKCREFNYACKKRMREQKTMDLYVVEEGCGCSNGVKSILGENGLYSVYDEAGRVLVRNRCSVEIKRILRDSRAGYYFLRREYPFPSRVYRLMVIDGEVRLISRDR